MDGTMISGLFILLLALVAGAELGKGVRVAQWPLLLTTLTALSGVALLGALPIAGQRPALDRTTLLGFLAVLFATINLAGGYLASHRQLAALPPAVTPAPESEAL